MRDAADVLLTLAEPLAIPSEIRSCPLSERLDADVARLLREGLGVERAFTEVARPRTRENRPKGVSATVREKREREQSPQIMGNRGELRRGLKIPCPGRDVRVRVPPRPLVFVRFSRQFAR